MIDELILIVLAIFCVVLVAYDMVEKAEVKRERLSGYQFAVRMTLEHGFDAVKKYHQNRTFDSPFYRGMADYLEGAK